MRKIIIVLTIVILVYLGYRVLLCYTLLPAANTGDLKHKEGAVYYFPRVWFNPFKKQELIDRIEFFNQQTLSQNGTSKTAIWWSRQIAEGDYKLISIKDEGNSKHMLVRHRDNETTIVFVMTDGEVTGFY